MIACPNCRSIQPADNVNTGLVTPCPKCSVMLRGDVFPAFYRVRNTPLAASAIQEQDKAECFNHPGKQALTACSICGRLLCSLCEINLDSTIFCIPCLESGKEKKKISALENQRLLYDNLALAFAFCPILFVFPTLITAPVSLFITLRYWKTPGSIQRRSRFRFVLAFVLASLQIAGWIFFIAQVLD
ncbi:MAG: hypothetical protein GY874_21390 [Desulfobacteraceae bacterium]|nr:hypothetical protein [Desulfobacteraceae bacterium]